MEINIPEEDLIDDGSIVNLKCVFGCIAIVPTSIYNKVFWSAEHGYPESEHHGFCQELLKYGTLTLNTNIKFVKCKYVAYNPDFKYVRQYDHLAKILCYTCFENDTMIYYFDTFKCITPTTDVDDILQLCISKCINPNKVKIFQVNLNEKMYSIVMNIFNVNIQIRMTNGGGSSGCIVDSCFLNNFVITTDDLRKNVINEEYENVIISTHLQNDDYSSEIQYSKRDIDNICKQIVERKEQILEYSEGYNHVLLNRLRRYPTTIMHFLHLNHKSKVCFVTPYGDDNSGISDFSYATINEFAKHVDEIHIYTDCKIVDMSKQKSNIKFFKIDEILQNKDNYDEIIWVIGNSVFHNKMIKYGKDIGGTFLIHDETLYELYYHTGELPSYLDIIDPIEIRKMGHTVDRRYLCFHEISKREHKFIVHNEQLMNILKDHYEASEIFCVDYPTYNFEENDKLSESDVIRYRKLFGLDSKKVNLFLIGGLSSVKFPMYSFKILDTLIDLGVDATLSIFYNK